MTPMHVRLQDLLSHSRVQDAKRALAMRLYFLALKLEPAIGLALTETIATRIRLEFLAHQQNVAEIAANN